MITKELDRIDLSLKQLRVGRKITYELLKQFTE